MDARVKAGIAADEAALKAASVDYQIFAYVRAQHAFNNEISNARYSMSAAELARASAIAFQKANLG